MSAIIWEYLKQDACNSRSAVNSRNARQSKGVCRGEATVGQLQQQGGEPLNTAVWFLEQIHK
jgi:hypothetical protein